MKRFNKSFTQQEPIPQRGVHRAVQVLQSGRLHRYNTEPNEQGETALFEAEYAHYQEVRYCLAVTSGGQALQIALRAAGFAPVIACWPTPIHSHLCRCYIRGWCRACIGRNRRRLANRYGRFTGKSPHEWSEVFAAFAHARPPADMESICALCRELDIVLIEDCAHTMGAQWRGEKSGNFGAVACFSTQTYKHLNSGEGGIITTNNAELAARAIVLSVLICSMNDTELRLQPTRSKRFDWIRRTVRRGSITCGPLF